MNNLEKKIPTLHEDSIDPLNIYRLPSTDELNDKEFSIIFNTSSSLIFNLKKSSAQFSSYGTEWPETGQGSVDVVKVRDYIYFIDIDTDNPAIDGMTIILSLKSGWAVAIYQRREVPEEQWSRGPEVKQDYRVGKIDGHKQIENPPLLTRDLVGARNFMMMGPKNLYEHIYINSQKIFAHHVDTKMVRGKAERHPATYYKLEENLYLVGWREMDNAAALITIEDYQSKSMTGKAFHPVSLFESRSRPVGGKIIPVNGALTYPEGLEPL